MSDDQIAVLWILTPPVALIFWAAAWAYLNHIIRLNDADADRAEAAKADLLMNDVIPLGRRTAAPLQDLADTLQEKQANR